MHIFDLKASVGYGASLDINALIFIIHLSKQPENVYWSVSYDYSQLSRIDQLIAKNCNYIRHSHFPRLYEDDIKPLVKYLLDIESGSKLLRPIGGLQTLYHRSNKSEKLIITKLNRLREVVESWFHLILLRFHVMPFKVKEELMNIFCLPYGPVKETDAVKFGLDKILSETKLAPHRSVLTKASMNAAYVEVVQREVELADSLPPLLYVSVIKGPRNERGKQEYTVGSLNY